MTQSIRRKQLNKMFRGCNKGFSMENARSERLVRGLRRWDLVALVINSIIGAGIFGLPARVFAIAGTYSLLAYVVSAAAIGLIILCFAEVGSRFNATGGPYLYARATFGPLVGFQVGWLLWVGRIAAFASLANLFVAYLAYFIPGIGDALWRSTALAAIVLTLAATNIGGVRLTTAVTNALTIGKLIPLCVLMVVGVFFIDPQRYSVTAPPSYASFSQAALLLVFTYMGFEGASIPTGEMRDPGRHLPFAMLVGMAVVTLVYISVQAVVIGTVPDLASSERPLADAGLHFLGPPGGSLIALGALVSIGGTLNALMFATPRLLFGMGENRQLPPVFLATHPRYRTPVLAILVTAGMTLMVALSSTFISALTISAIVRLLAYMSTCAALPVLRRNAKLTRAPFVIPGGAFVSVVAVILTVWLLSNSPWNEMRIATIALVVGLVLYIVSAYRLREAQPAAVPHGG
jgi:amino acid transporter